MKGGAYATVRTSNEGGEVHHIPAAASSHLSKDEGPSIWMETADHHQTASWGRSRGAMTYRKQQRELIQQGRFLEAQQMDIEDVRSKFGGKYDEGIQQALNYTFSIRDRLIPPDSDTIKQNEQI